MHEVCLREDGQGWHDDGSLECQHHDACAMSVAVKNATNDKMKSETAGMSAQTKGRTSLWDASRHESQNGRGVGRLKGDPDEGDRSFYVEVVGRLQKQEQMKLADAMKSSMSFRPI